MSEVVKKAPRVALFYGTDSRASLAEVRRWVGVFHQKYGNVTHYSLSADELGIDQTLKGIQQAVAGQSLFPEPKLVVVKRLSALDPKKGKVLQPLLKWLDGQIEQLDVQITVVLWEDRDLPESHALLEKAGQWKEAGLLSLKRFQVPDNRNISGYINQYLEGTNTSVTPEGLRWLQEQYRFLDREARLRLRLRQNDQRLEDERSWWLAGVLEGALTCSQGAVITLEDIQAGHAALESPVGVFEISEAVGNMRWQEAAELLQRFSSQGADDSAYFGLYAALAWQIQRGQSRFSQEVRAAAMELLAEIEVVSKVFPLTHAWLAELFVIRLRQRVESKEYLNLVDRRVMWLASLARS